VSIRNGASVAALFNPRSQLVDNNGVPTAAIGRGFLQAMYVRTGSGTGIVPIVSAPLTATGSTINDALQLGADWNYITTAVAGSGAAIASALNLQPGNDIWVFNFSGHSVKIYPPSVAAQIDALGAGDPYSLANGARSRCFQCLTATQFSSYGN